MTKGSYEAHTATFGPGDIEDPSSYLGGIAASFESPSIDPQGVYPSDVDAGRRSARRRTATASGTRARSTPSAASPLPESSSVKFDTPGTYKYYCLIHPFMVGTVTVQ